MSNAIFPTLPGLQWDVKKTPQWSTKVQQSAGGKELRASYFSYPIYKYTLSYDVLRQASAYQELQTLMGFINSRQGKYDTFLFQDPNDNSVANHGFGIGDGSTTQFQLQRTAGGPRFPDNVSGSVALAVPTIGRYNALQQSGSLTTAPWAANTGGGGTAPTTTANAAVAPDGFSGATKIAFPSLTGGQWSGWEQSQATVLGSNGNMSNETWTFSIWLRADSPCVVDLILEENPFVSHGTTVIANVTTQWQRFSVTYAFPAGSSNGANVHLRSAGATGAVTLYAWGAQLENNPTPTQYIPTTSAAVTARPNYWPATGDGFEPVYDLNTVAQAPVIQAGGATKVYGTDYTISSSGLVTFTTAPTAGAFLLWSGSYYWRCRFDLDAVDFNEFLYQLWELKQLTFVTVK